MCSSDLNYGSGSVKRNGIYDQVVAILKEADKTIVENPGVMSYRHLWSPCMNSLATEMLSSDGSDRMNCVFGNLPRLFLTRPPVPHPVSSQMRGFGSCSKMISDTFAISSSYPTILFDIPLSISVCMVIDLQCASHNILYN